MPDSPVLYGRYTAGEPLCWSVLYTPVHACQYQSVSQSVQARYAREGFACSLACLLGRILELSLFSVAPVQCIHVAYDRRFPLMRQWAVQYQHCAEERVSHAKTAVVRGAVFSFFAFFLQTSLFPLLCVFFLFLFFFFDVP